MQVKRSVTFATMFGAGTLLSAAGCERGDGGESDAANARASATQGAEIASAVNDNAGSPRECALTGNAAMFGTVAPIGGVVTEDSPAQVGRFGPPLTPSVIQASAPTCSAANPMPTVVDTDHDVRYQQYSFKNWNDTDACISLYATTPFGTNVGDLQMAAFVGTFDPIDIHQNVLAATGVATQAQVSFRVAAMDTFEVVMIGEARSGADGGTFPLDVTFQFWVANCGQAPTSDAGSSSGGSSSGGSSSGGSSSGGSSSGGGNGKSW